MAKVKDEPLFVEPEFDEREFIRNEKERAKSIIVVFIIGAILGGLSGYFNIIGLWYFSVLIIFIFLLFLKFILNALRIEMPKKASHKLFLGGEFILTWLLFWILILNPPAHVLSGPQISGLQFDAGGGNWTAVSEPSLNVYNLPVTDHSVRLYVNYKYPITSVSITESQAGSTASPTTLPSHLSGSYVYFNLSGSTGTQNAKIITVTANSDHGSNSYQFTVSFSAPPSIVYSAYGQGIGFRAGVV